MISTIGYERADLSDFIATLALCQVQVLVDIRDRAQSRRPGFSKSALSNALAQAGIGYLHIKELGDPKPGREAARSGNFDRFREIFNEVMSSEIGKKALSELEILASDQNICLMCFERDQHTCHRKIVADHLEGVLDEKVRHLGVEPGAGKKAAARRVRHFDQGPASSVQQVL